jgi:hypothetical protein
MDNLFIVEINQPLPSGICEYVFTKNIHSLYKRLLFVFLFVRVLSWLFTLREENIVKARENIKPTKDISLEAMKIT